ncbi:phage tail tip lysozyme [Vagococcus fluvialis]|uniref:phage tail tip lysozyme n=1 Tax=Vagococcus fluvialis TaxID=2738 RepID=UPI001D0B9102|nr:phage tail tip lysozyme [Vagococcus fluvialis]UDM78940.1 peptidoglycan DD-metalloendopeptidase family protein [Vagococcus fluvialis]
MSNFIYAYDEIPDDLELNGATLTDYLELPEIHRILNNKYQIYIVYQLDGQNVEYLKKGNFVKARWVDGSYQYFELSNPVKNLNSISILGRHIGFMLNRNFIENSFTSSGTGQTIMNNLYSSLVFKQPFKFKSDITTMHQFTAKEVKPLEAIIGSNSGSQNLVGVTSGELDFDNYEISLKRRIGTDNNYRIGFGHNLLSIEETVDEDGIANSLYLVGGTPETDYNEDKDPIVFKYLEIKGVTDENRRIVKRENSNIDNIDDLKKWGQSLFDKDRIHEPSVTHDVSMIDLSMTTEYKDLYSKLARLNFGDTVHVNVKKLNIRIAERLVECVWYPTIFKYKSMVLGNDLSMYTYQVENKTQVMKQEMTTNKDMLVDSILNATAWITGNKGGHVIQRPEKEPNEILIMDKKDVNEAKNLWRWNLGGLGHSSNGIDGPYGTAITQDGKIVADFIKAGTLNGVKIIAENKTFKIQLFDGKISFFNAKNGDYLGMLFATFNSSGDVNGVAFEQEPGYIFSLNSGDKATTQSMPVLQIPADSTKDKRKLNLFGEVRLKGDFYVNDVKIDTNGGGSGGGGGWNGKYPPELTQAFEKYAWQLYQMLLSMGYSRESACGILGNVQGEVGPSMNPDTEQVGGPAYGCVQWDGSAYPLVGSPTWNGREYVQRLMDAARIVDDYTTYKAQAPLIDWCMYNGQWIGQVYPTSVTAFKRLADPKTAAHAFEMNFERPAAAHPEREVYAQRWFDKFKDLKQPANDNYIKPMNQYTVTSEFGWRPSPINGTMEFHNAIDLANGGGSPILASNEGKVVQAGANHWDWYGNYVVIQHSDGLYTGYAHLSRIDVTVGQQVNQGQQIGLEGATGPVTGPHLHFQFMKSYQNGWPIGGENDFINPREFINF